MEKCTLDGGKLQEIRLRTGQPLWVLHNGCGYLLSEKGEVVKHKTEAYLVEEKDLRQTLEYASEYSLYAYENEKRQGFLTISGGHRIGLAGSVVVEQGKIKNIVNISMLNIRVACEYIGCAKEIMSFLVDGKEVKNVLIVSPPGGGKTTLLRDVIRNLSSEQYGYTVGVVDERGEIAACYRGVPQNDLGITTDVLDGCPKGEGMEMLLRSMAPDVIAVDELSVKEKEEVMIASNGGCKILATIHGENLQQVEKKGWINGGDDNVCFDRIILMKNRFHPGKIEKVYDKDQKVIWADKEMV
jgi:stage III sporulation protein AA